MRKLHSILLFAIFSLVICPLGWAQKQTNHWRMYDYKLDFNSGLPVVTTTPQPYFNDGAATVSDAAGNLLFYTNGNIVWDKTGNSMPNGTDLLPSPSSQAIIAVPKPGSTSIYYVFAVDPGYYGGPNTAGLYYSMVDMQLAGGLGDVTVKKVKLFANASNMLSAAFHANDSDVWVVANPYNTNKFSVIQITSSGISVIDYPLGPVFKTTGGQLKFSTDGKKIAVSLGDSQTGVTVVDFNSTTGVPSNPLVLNFTDLSNSSIPDGLEFSSDGTKLYVSEWRTDRIYQFDLTLPTQQQVQGSRTPVGLHVIYNLLRQFQLASDGKIYITKSGGGGGTAHLGIIHNPNAPAAAVIFQENGLYLQGGDSFVGYTPKFIQNYLFKTSFRFSKPCDGKPVFFEVTNTYRLDSVMWKFGEGSSSKVLSPSFQYPSSGTYHVTLVAYYPTRTDTIKQQVTVDPSPAFDFGPDKSVCFGTKLSVPDGFSSYLWTTGETVRTLRIEQSGTFKATVTNSFGCAFKDSIVLSVNPLPIINLPDTVVIGESNSAVLDAGTFQSYAWNTGATSATIEVSQEGWYSVLVQDANNCSNAKSVYVSKWGESPPANIGAWYRLNPKPWSGQGNDIAFADDRNGFIANSQALLRTIDGGESWHIQLKQPGNDIDFKNLIGYLVGDNGVVYKSTQLGGGWNRLNFASSDNLNAVTVLHQDSVIITSDNKLFMTSNGGQTWTTKSIPGVNVEDSYFTSWRVGHAACQGGTILKTTDGGTTWRITTSTNVFPSNFVNITFMTNTIGFATREHSELFKTTDGGETWTTSYFGGLMYGFSFPGSGIGFAAGEYGAIFKTLNGGGTWTFSGSGPLTEGSNLLSIYFLDDQTGFATGFKGRILKTINGGITWTEYASSYGYISDVDFPTEQIGYFLAGHKLSKTIDGGTSWINIGAPLTEQKCPSFEFVNADIGYAIAGGSTNTSASSNMVYKTTNGGLHWAKAHTAPQVSSIDLSYLFFVNESTGFASGYPYTTYRTIDGGVTWSVISSTRLDQMQFLSSQIGFARSTGSTNYRIVKTTDGGATWSTILQLSDEIKSFSFPDEQTGYYLRTYYGDFYKTSNGGSTWQQLEIPSPTQSPREVMFITSRLGYVISEYGMILKTYNGGFDWIVDHDEPGLYTLFSSPWKVLAAGYQGSLVASDLNLSGFIWFDPLTLGNATSGATTVSSAVHSARDLTNATLLAEIGTRSGHYDQTYEVKLLNGFVSEEVTFEFEGLLDNTEYFCRFVVMEDGEKAPSPEFAFTNLITGTIDNPEKLIRVYPNPAMNALFVDVKPGEDFSYEIVDLLGRNLLRGATTPNSSIDVDTLRPGIYLVTISTRDLVRTFRIIKQ